MTSFLQQLLNSLNGQPPHPAGKKLHRRSPPDAGADWLALAQSAPAHSRTVCDPTGAVLFLKKDDMLAHGGEGVVYTFRKNPAFLIKVCKDDTLNNPHKLAAFRDRLNAMLALEECRNAPFLAWPLMPVFDADKHAVGFAMRRCSGRTLRALYAPCQVKRFFPGWDRLAVTRAAPTTAASPSCRRPGPGK